MDQLSRQLVDASAEGMWVLDLDGRTVHANQACADVLDVPLSELLRSGVEDFLDPPGRRQWRAHLLDLRDGRPHDRAVDVGFVTRDGSHRFVRVRETALRGDDGSVTGMVHHLRSEAAEASRAAALKEARRDLQDAHRLVRLGTYTWDVSRDEFWGNEDLAWLFGYSLDDYPLSMQQLRDLVPEPDLPVFDGIAADLRRGALSTEATLRIRDKHGVYRWYTARGQLHHDHTTGALQLRGTMQDVDRQRTLELQLERAVSQLDVMRAVAQVSNESNHTMEALVMLRDTLLRRHGSQRARGFLVDHDGTLVRYSIQDTDLDAAGADESREQTEEEAIAARSRDAAAVVWDDAGDPWRGAFPILDAGGSAVAVIALAFAVSEYADSATLRAQVGQACDMVQQVYEREQASNALAQARDEAEKALRAKSDFLAMMSHEIRTPLNGVLGLNELLQRSSLTANQRELSDGIGATGRHLLTLINDILDFSKIEAGRMELESIDFDLRGAIESAAAMIGGQACRKQVDLCTYIDPALPAVVNGDPTRLAQVITNLVSNAVKFTDEGSVTVRLDARGDEGPDGGVRLRMSVADTGTGIPAEAQEAIFAEFGQADRSTSRTHGGTGLGLAICQRIVGAYGGQLTVESTPGEGSVFACDITLGSALVSAENPLDAEMSAVWSERTIIIATRSAERFALLAAKVSMWGSQLHHAENAAVAVGMTGRLEGLGAVVVDLAHRGGVADQVDAATLRRLHQAVGPDVRVLVLGSRPAALAAEAGLTSSVHCLTFPVATSALRIALADAPHTEGGAPQAPARRGARILVVEDNPVNQMVATGMLELLGYEHEVAEHGGAAVEMFDPARHAAVLMDVQMPVLDGYEATRRIHASHPGLTTPIIAMTANAIEGEQQRCLDAGMSSFLTKPVDVRGLAATLEEHLAGWAPERDADPDAAAPAPPPAPPPAPATAPATATTKASGGEDSWETLREDLAGIVDTGRIDDLLEMGPGAVGLVTPAMSRLIDSLPAELEKLLDAYRERHGDDLAAAAHRIAGSASNLGVVAVGSAARSLEETARGTSEPDGLDGLDALIAHLAREVGRAVPALERCLWALLPDSPAELLDGPSGGSAPNDD